MLSDITNNTKCLSKQNILINKDISINKLKQKLEISLKQNSFSFKLYSKKAKWSISAKKQTTISYIKFRHNSTVALHVFLKVLMLN